MEELSLKSVNDNIITLSNNVDNIINRAHNRINEYLEINGIPLGNIYNEYIGKNQHIDMLHANNLLVSNMQLNSKSFIDNDKIVYGDNSLSLTNGLKVNEEQVLLEDDTCFSLSYEGVYTTYLIKDKSEIVVSGLYNGTETIDLIIPVSMLSEISTSVFGYRSAGVTVTRSGDECSIVPTDSGFVITNVIMR